MTMVLDKAQVRKQVHAVAVAMMNWLLENHRELNGMVEVELEGFTCRAYKIGKRQLVQTPKMMLELPEEFAEVLGGPYLVVVLKNTKRLVFIEGPNTHEGQPGWLNFDNIWAGYWKCKTGPVTMETPIKWRKGKGYQTKEAQHNG